MWERGKRSRSSRVTSKPSWASRPAAVEPAGPPPTTRIRVEFRIGSTSQTGDEVATVATAAGAGLEGGSTGAGRAGCDHAETAVGSAAAMRTALVTGANRGLGRAVATRLSETGHRVVVAARSAADASRAAALLPGPAVGVALDVTDPSGARAVRDRIGPVDI